MDGRQFSCILWRGVACFNSAVCYWLRAHVQVVSQSIGRTHTHTQGRPCRRFDCADTQAIRASCRRVSPPANTLHTNMGARVICISPHSDRMETYSRRNHESNTQRTPHTHTQAHEIRHRPTGRPAGWLADCKSLTLSPSHSRQCMSVCLSLSVAECIRPLRLIYRLTTQCSCQPMDELKQFHAASGQPDRHEQRTQYRQSQ